MSRNYVTNFRGESCTPDMKMRIKDEPETPDELSGDMYHNFDYHFDSGDFNMRKSMSMNDINALRQDLVKLELAEHEENYQKKKANRTTGQNLEISRTRFVSMAEAIYHFQRDTPGRFHSTRPQTFKSQGPTGKAGLTRPQSPVLRCKLRTRPAHVMSQKEREELELEEMKKFKHKAQPIPKSVIVGSRNLPGVQKKPSTVPEPFNLTETHKKTVDCENHLQAFKARPAPKHILNKPHMPVKQPAPLTGPEPFSFDKYDEERKKKREERIKQQLLEEKKQASSFKAQPLPGAVKKRMYSVTSSNKCSSNSSENKENHIKFEARPPVVLYKEPFKPVLQTSHIIKPAPFSLNTQKRAEEREKFDQQLKEREEEQERLRLQKEKEQQELEERAKMELRAKLVHHPKPVPAFEPFVPEKSIAPLTVPETPKFVRKLNNKH